jgi:heptosyltransferase-2
MKYLPISENPQACPMQMTSSIVFGVFKGMGDLVCAAPVILSELQQHHSVHLLLFPSATIREFCSLIDFAPFERNLHLHTVPASSNLGQWKQFIAEMRCLNPELVWISPHAPRKDSSWKIPLGLRIIQSLFWRNARLVGADTERLAMLLHQRLPVDRALPLQKREWSAYRLFRGASLPEQAPAVRFVREIEERRHQPPIYDLVIHPGANALNRTWPFDKYAPLIRLLPTDWRIALLGLPSDLALLKQTMPSDRPIEYVTGSIGKAIQTLASARLLFVMDSGNMHFAQVLGVPAVVVFGYTDPASIVDSHGVIDAIYEPHLPCQPCREKVCSQPEIYCLDSIEPEDVARRLQARENRIPKRTSPSHLVRISYL